MIQRVSISRNNDSRDHHIKKKKEGHDFKAKANLGPVSIGSKPQWTLRISLCYNVCQQCDGPNYKEILNFHQCSF